MQLPLFLVNPFRVPTRKAQLTVPNLRRCRTDAREIFNLLTDNTPSSIWNGFIGVCGIQVNNVDPLRHLLDLEIWVLSIIVPPSDCA